MDYSEMAKRNQIVKVRVGSHLFGTDTPDSDTDYAGIFMPNRDLVFGMGECKEVDLGVVDKDETGRNTADAIDYKIYEYRRFCRLALENNPNILNMLFVNDANVVFTSDYGERLRGKAHLFPHRGCIRRFKGYAMSQLKKMDVKPENYQLLKFAEEILSDKDPWEQLLSAIGGIIVGSPFVDDGPGKHIRVGDIFFERGLQVSKALKMIRGRIDRASSRVNNWEKFGFDTKFASNLIQMLTQCVEIVKTGRICFPLNNASLILSIKRGEYSREEIVSMAEMLEKEIEFSKENSCLPKSPRFTEIRDFVIDEVYRWSIRDHE